MLLIRWLGTELRILAYVQNTILVVCFLGLGVGCGRTERNVSPHEIWLPLTLLYFLILTPLTRPLMQNISNYLSVLDDTVIWYQAIANSTSQKMYALFLGTILSFVVLLLVFDVFDKLGQVLANEFATHSHTVFRYSINILGSLVGTLLFALLSYLSTPPLVWTIAASALMFLVFFSVSGVKKLSLLLLAAPIVPFLLFTDSTSNSTVWSPYQKLSIEPYPHSPNAQQIRVNNVGYQLLLDLSADNISAHPSAFPATRHDFSTYDIPFRFVEKPGNVLIVGAGAGNDAAGALRAGAAHITAVEIDPVILDFGKRLHREHPYQSDRVTIVSDDARSFLGRTQEKFDVIIFGLLDAHTGNSLTNVRLDHFIYTREALALAKSRLTPHGKLFLSFGLPHEHIISRIATLLTEQFKKPPLVFFSETAASLGWGGTMLVSSNLEDLEAKLQKDSRLAEIVNTSRRNVSTAELVPTDDWPYLYLPTATIPLIYYLLGAVIIAVFWLRSRHLFSQFKEAWSSADWHFFFLGAAFLLLETQNINKAALLFANTWIVNVIVICGIMIMTLFSNLVYSSFKRISSLPLSIGLILSCILLYLVPLQVLASFELAPRVIVFCGLISMPVLFSGLLFVRAFDNAMKPERALAINLAGALIGGSLQSLSFMIGMHGLLLLTILIYVAAAGTAPKLAIAQEN